MSKDKTAGAAQGNKVEANILKEVMACEKKAEIIITGAEKQKESILHEARINASRLLLQKEEDIRKSKEKRIADARSKSKKLHEEKLNEGALLADKIRSKASKNMKKSIGHVMKKFEDYIKNV
jgi:vacuolar-type H+-ATPase subunit H